MTERTKNQPHSFETTETNLKIMLRNALMIAGKEMGETGDHWPVIKNTITDLMGDWQQLEIERAVTHEVSKAFYKELHELEVALAALAPSVQEKVGPRLAELREVYDAAFLEPEYELIDLTGEDEDDDASQPIHIRRAGAILDTLFDEKHKEEAYV